MRNRILRAVKYVLLCLPLLLGLIGLLSAGEGFGNSLYSALSMYLLQYQSAAPNVLTGLARWTAPLATIFGVLSAVPSVRERIYNFVCWRAGKSVAVYGPETERKLLLAQLGRRGIEGRDRVVRAGRYVLLWDEAKNFLFWAGNHDQLEYTPVYFRCSHLPPQSAEDPMLRLFCPEETAARLFWPERCLFELSAGCDHRMRIVFLGFGRLGEEMLYSALLCNIFSPEQRIEYHIFGDCSVFTGSRAGLAGFGDAVVEHTEPWYKSLSLLEEAQVVIVLEQDGQLELLKNLLLALRRREIDVFDAGGGECELLSGRERLSLFAWKERAFSPKCIFSDALLDRARHINLRLGRHGDKTEETPERLREQWHELDAFTRRERISQAAYHGIRLKMLGAIGSPPDPSVMPPELLELLAGLEHTRRCRYYILNSHTDASPEAGMGEDPARRGGAQLIPYDALPEDEKETVRETVRMLLDVK